MPVLLKKNYSGLISGIIDEVRERLERNDTGSFIYISPTNRKIRSLQREFLLQTPDKTAPAFNLFTLETLASELHLLLPSPRRLISGSLQGVVLEEAVRACADGLKYFRFRGSHGKVSKATLARIINVIDALKEKGVYLSALISELETAEGFERHKLSDILLIYEAYEKMLGTRFTDSAGLYKLVNEQWDSGSSPLLVRSRFARVDSMFVSGFDEFSDPELTMLYNLSNIDGIGTVISFDYHLTNDEVFGHLKENYQKFSEMGFSNITVPAGKKETLTGHINDYLFRYDRNPPKFSSGGSVSLFAADNRRAEAELIAKIVKLSVHEKPDRDLSRICVATFQPKLYTNLFRDAFDKYGIPANITDRYYLDQSPPIISVMSLLGVEVYGYRVQDIMRVLSGPYLKILDNGEPVDASSIYDTAVRLKIFSGKSNWLERIRTRMERLASGDTGYDSGEYQVIREEKVLRKAYSGIERLSSVLFPLTEKMTPQEFKRKLFYILDELKFRECILEGEKTFENDEELEKDTRAYQKFLHFMDEFLEVLAFEKREGSREKLHFYVERLREAISQVRYNIHQKYGYGVSVTSFDETRGLQFDIMIIAGLIDGEFPPAYQPEIFLSAKRRARKEKYHLQEHRYLFYQAMTNFTEHLCLTYPETDGETELVPSSFIEGVTRIVDLSDYRKQLPSKLTEAVLSDHEMLACIGKTICSGSDEEKDRIKTSLTGHGKNMPGAMEYIIHAAGIEGRRLKGLPAPEYNGVLGGRLTGKCDSVLLGFRDRVYSVTQLESYASCPFRFFSKNVLRLSTVGDLEEGLTPVERGSVIHDILFRFYADRRERKLPALSETDDVQFEQAAKELLDLAGRKLRDLNISDLFWNIDKENLTGSPNRKGVLREFLEAERKSGIEAVPSYFEAAFGIRPSSYKKTDPDFSYEKPVEVGGVRVRGKVDRIDLGPGFFRIVDYKTGGRTGGKNEIDRGISLQLPIYLYAVGEILTAKMGISLPGAAGVYYILRSPVKETLGLGNAEYNGMAFSKAKSSDKLLKNGGELSSVIRRAIGYVNRYADNISSGHFPVEPQMPEQVCKYCDFRTICRIETGRRS